MEAVIFDMDGVLIDSEPVSKLVFAKAFEKTGLIFSEEIYQKILGRSLKDIELFLTEEYRDEKLATEIIEIREQEFRDYYEQHPITVKKGVYEVLDFLEKKRIKKAVATSAKKTIAEQLMRKTNLLDRMDEHCYGSEVKEAKPNPELFLKAAERLGVEPQKTYIIEDSQSGIIAANTGGFVPIYIPENGDEFPENHNYHYTVVKDLSVFCQLLKK